MVFHHSTPPHVSAANTAPMFWVKAMHALYRMSYLHVFARAHIFKNYFRKAREIA